MSQKIARLAGAVIAFVVLVLGGMAMSSGSAFAGTHSNVQSLHYQPGCYGEDCYSISETYTGPGGSYTRTETGSDYDDWWD
jgi:hypothetical protein